MNTNDYISDYQKHIGINIEKLMKKQNITQKEMETLCLEAGYNISQSTISNAKRGRGNITISNLLAIAYALKVDIMELIDVPYSLDAESEKQEKSLFNIKEGTFITNPESIYIQCYIGTYHVLFYKTSGSGNAMVRGTLEIKSDSSGKKCEAILRLKLEEYDSESQMQAEKIYKGQLVASPAMRSMYIFLSNSKIGEASMLLFQQIYTSYHYVETAMAVAITTASGANRRPTVHRMCLSRKEVGSADLNYIKGQLLMNTADIFLTNEQLESIYNNSHIPESFKVLLKKAAAKGCCYRIPESSLLDASLNETELFKVISYVRLQSVCSKYNKISKKTDENLYNLLKEKNRDKTD